MTLDCIHYPITEPRPFTTDYSSFKLGKAAGISYEYGIYTHKDKLAWIHHDPAGTNDITQYRNELKQKIQAKQAETSLPFRLIVDAGYIAAEEMPYLSWRNEFDDSEIAYFKDRALSRHETFNGYTKHYRCLTTKFRHDKGDNPNRQHPRHVACVTAICVTIQCELDLKIKSLTDPYSV